MDLGGGPIRPGISGAAYRGEIGARPAQVNTSFQPICLSQDAVIIARDSVVVDQHDRRVPQRADV